MLDSFFVMRGLFRRQDWLLWVSTCLCLHFSKNWRVGWFITTAGMPHCWCRYVRNAYIIDVKGWPTIPVWKKCSSPGNLKVVFVCGNNSSFTHAYFRQLHGGSLVLPPLSVLTAVNISLHCFTAKTIDHHKILTTAVMTSSRKEQTVISEMTSGQSTAWSVTRGNGQKEEETLMSRNDCFLFNILIHTSSSHTNCKRGWDGGLKGWKRWDTQKRIREDWSGVKKDDVKVCKKKKE